MTFFELRECKTAKQLMCHLDPNHKLWQSDRAFQGLQGWLFRGQANADWGLVPSAWRIGKKDNTQDIYKARESLRSDGYLGKPYNHNLNDKEIFLIDNATTEINLLHRFVELCNRQGLYIPEYQEIIDFLVKKYSYGTYLRNMGNENLITEYAFWRLGITALAQHHRIPTRLLDWTYNSRKAAYFAIENPNKDATYIAIFALHQGIITEPRIQSRLTNSIKLISHARYQNTFINAQEGIFTCDESGEAYYMDNDNLDFPPLEKTLEKQYAPILKDDLHWDPPTYKFTLPVDQIDDLRQLLIKEDIHQASVKPTYDNIAKQSMINIGIDPNF